MNSEDKRTSKLNPAAVASIRSFYRMGKSSRAIAADYRISYKTVLQIVRGETWKDVPGAISQAEFRRLRPRENGFRKPPQPNPEAIKRRDQQLAKTRAVVFARMKYAA